MRVLIIDPYQSSIIEADMPDEFAAMRMLLSPLLEKPVSMIERVNIPVPNHSLWVDEEGRMNGRMMGFEVPLFYPEPMVGKGVLIGEDKNGEWIDCMIDPSKLKQIITMVKFTEETRPKPNLTVTAFTTIDDLMEEMFGPKEDPNEVPDDRNIH